MKRKPLSERTGELTGSMLSGALIVAALNFVFVLLMVREAGTFPSESVAIWGQYAWLTVTGTVGTWLLLLAGKAWEGSEGDALHKYVVLLILGLVLGTVAFGSAELLMVSLPDFDQWTDHGLTNSQLARSLYGNDGTPLWGAYLVYFGGLFAVLRWWSQADPLRRSRMSLWATGMCILWAWVLHIFCRFPQPWGLMLAASISVAVQLSATWLHPRDRVEIGQGMNQA